jgi:hypothetical protein
MKNFSFSFFCDRCGKEWRSDPVPFTKAGFAEVDHKETLSLLWNDEHKAAFERANLDAMFRFSQCPSCGRTVCDDCFHVSGEGVTDICLDCLAERRGKSGNPRHPATRPGE